MTGEETEGHEPDAMFVEIRVSGIGEEGCGYMEVHEDHLVWRDFCLVVHSLIGTLPAL